MNLATEKLAETLSETGRPILQARGIGKSFGGQTALAEVDLVLHAGEILGLVGANGAGKSTLIKIICGAVAHDAGELVLDGTEVRFQTVADALAAGIAVAHQQLAIIPPLTAAENIMLGREPTSGFLIRDRALLANARRLAERFGVGIDLEIPCEALSLGENKILDILKALVAEPRILILDEPTASLTINETRLLFAFLDDLKARGLGIVFISHHLGEVFGHCDRVAVLKDGRKVHDGPVASLTRDALVRMMVGRTIEDTDWRARASTGPVAVMICSAQFGDLHVPELTVRAGEVVGLAGVLGAGQTGLLETLAGLPPTPPDGDADPIVNNRPGLPKTVAEAIARGICLVADERQRKALFPGLTVAENLQSASLARIAPGFFLRRKRADRLAAAMIERLRIKCTGPGQEILHLSGGNQQKVVFGRWLMRLDAAEGPVLLLLDNPTEGVDVGSKAEIYGLIRDMAARGASVLIGSAEFAELIALCDRIYCIRNRALRCCLEHAEFSEDRLLLEVS